MGVYGVGSSALTHGNKVLPHFSLLAVVPAFPARRSLRLASRRCVHRSFVDIRALQHLRHSYASRTADIAAPHASSSCRSCTSMRYMLPQACSASCSLHSLLHLAHPRAAANCIEHGLQRQSLRMVCLSKNLIILNMTCAAGAPKAPSTGRKPGILIWKTHCNAKEAVTG